jgi:hypothetical protein
MDERSNGAGVTHATRHEAELAVALGEGVATFPGGDVRDDGRGGMRVRWTGPDGRQHVEHVGAWERGMLARSTRLPRLPLPPAVPAEARTVAETMRPPVLFGSAS